LRSTRRTTSQKVETEWGDALNFDGAQSGPVREYFVSNAGYWIAEYHLDGLRLDATQSIPRPVRGARGRRDRSHGARRRRTGVAVARRRKRAAGREASSSRATRADTASMRCGTTTFITGAFVALTGRREAYYSDHRGVPQEFISATKYGYLFQGQRYGWQKQASRAHERRGCGRQSSSTSSRTTISSRTPAMDRGCDCAPHRDGIAR
jgi:maltooligosyltrehalose trehalohydrolase